MSGIAIAEVGNLLYVRLFKGTRDSVYVERTFLNIPNALRTYNQLKMSAKNLSDTKCVELTPAHPSVGLSDAKRTESERKNSDNW